MALVVSVQERSTTHYVGIPVTARFSEFCASDGPNEMIPRVYQWLADHDVTPQGGPLYVYRHFGSNRDEPVDLTVAVPVPGPVKPSNGLVLGSLPAGSYVVGRFTGHPDGISACQPEITEWAESEDLRLGGLIAEDGTTWTGYIEHYLTDPADEPDPSKWTIELLFKTT
ncbi:GyrI-like domain-containing protein [Corynebacterium falsenii]|uniref:GyrI-like domain-containing protein n=1 Tax=Corynebacterium falsenii TaxID=108486 RepID=UPI001D9906A3|nr:GyrI-like domain-containing protein [Corynebacterium falsenii]HJF13022.1 GyrI-like domain-containing protein [Corynebacterium falsenii]